jgi:hypothetical protein
MNDRKNQDSSGTGQLPAQRAMKQLSKTDSEREQPVGPNAGPGPTPSREPDAPHRGDTGVRRSDNQGSSPSADRAGEEEPQRGR